MRIILYFIFLATFMVSCSHIKKTLTHDEEVKDAKTPAVSFFQKGVKFFQKNQLKKALNLFEQINHQDKNFILALLEIQKIHYINKDWDQFFGRAFYYRNMLLSSKALAQKNFHQDLLTLEILALLRHCQFFPANQLHIYSLELAKKLKKPSSNIKKTKYFLTLQKRVGDPLKKPSDWKQDTHLWPVTSQQLKWVDNPKNIKMRVQNVCLPHTKEK